VSLVNCSTFEKDGHDGGNPPYGGVAGPRHAPKPKWKLEEAFEFLNGSDFIQSRPVLDFMDDLDFTLIFEFAELPADGVVGSAIAVHASNRRQASIVLIEYRI